MAPHRAHHTKRRRVTTPRKPATAADWLWTIGVIAAIWAGVQIYRYPWICAGAAALIGFIVLMWRRARREGMATTQAAQEALAPLPPIATPPAQQPQAAQQVHIIAAGRDILLRSHRGGTGAGTERMVTLRGATCAESPGGGRSITHIEGYCHLRHGPRTFKLSNVEWMADAATGEVITDLVGWLGLRDGTSGD